MTRPLTRQQLLLGAAAIPPVTGAMIAVGVSASQAALSGLETVAGAIVELRKDAIVLDSPSGKTTVQFAQDAQYWRDVDSSLSNFAVGDEVVATWADTTRSEANRLEPLYRNLRGRVRAANSVDVGAHRPMAIAPSTRIFNVEKSELAPDGLIVGSKIEALARWDARAQHWVGSRVQVV